MKTTTRTVPYFRLWMAAVLVGGWSATAVAQTGKKTDTENSVSVKIIERTNAGEVKEIDRTYRIDGMKDNERDALVNRLVDSLRARRGDKKTQITIIVEDNDGSDKPGSLRRRPDRLKRDDLTARRPNVLIGPDHSFHFYGPDRGIEFRHFKDGVLKDRFRFDTDSLADRMNRLEFKWPDNFGRRMDDAFRSWSWSMDEDVKAPTIRGLQVFPNNPETNQVNIRFSAPTKGDIRIRVTTPDGKEVARKDVKDFSGSYSGQIDLDKKAKGVYFVSVTQNEDGAVRRIVIP
ncbi:T9SS type A sorting domain-containing protein [Larkinella soli]|uniref:T9SS type A sorting domain-containing protein n=1 Tax=Larkinella soli TaxID=1770527 RepID=UPI000FFC6589|nr:T9SS type A sorting domain-containing protein [Larkinella soli]